MLPPLRSLVTLLLAICAFCDDSDSTSPASLEVCDVAVLEDYASGGVSGRQLLQGVARVRGKVRSPNYQWHAAPQRQNASYVGEEANKPHDIESKLDALLHRHAAEKSVMLSVVIPALVLSLASACLVGIAVMSDRRKPELGSCESMALASPRSVQSVAAARGLSSAEVAETKTQAGNRGVAALRSVAARMMNRQAADTPREDGHTAIIPAIHNLWLVDGRHSTQEKELILIVKGTLCPVRQNGLFELLKRDATIPSGLRLSVSEFGKDSGISLDSGEYSPLAFVDTTNAVAPPGTTHPPAPRRSLILDGSGSRVIAIAQQAGLPGDFVICPGPGVDIQGLPLSVRQWPSPRGCSFHVKDLEGKLVATFSTVVQGDFHELCFANEIDVGLMICVFAAVVKIS